MQEHYQSTQLYSLLSVRNLYTLILKTYDAGFIYLGESHDFWELSVILSGNAALVSENNVYNCGAGDAILHAPNMFHSMRVGGTPCRVFTISFDGAGLCQHLKAAQYRLTDNEKNYIDGIIQQAGRRDDIGLQIIKNQLELFCLSVICRGNAARFQPSTDARAKTYARIVDYLRDNVNKNLTIQQISCALYESPSKIKDVFHSFTGGGVMQYFNHLRCEQIMLLLGEGKSVKDIAAAMDFSSPYYLSYFFKRETGMTAREYKSKIQTSFDI